MAGRLRRRERVGMNKGSQRDAKQREQAGPDKSYSGLTFKR